MNSFTTIFAICCLAWTAKAKPGHGHEGLEGIPDIHTFGAIKYPGFNLIDLGEYSKGHVPATEIHETKHITVKEPQPYPVKIPVPHPYPVPVSKPYPVVETKIIKVPQPVPYEVVRNVPVPVEVPKPYPVQVHGNDGGGYGDLHHAGSGKSYGIQDVEGGVEHLGGDGQHLSALEGSQQQDEASYGDNLGDQADWQGSQGIEQHK